MRIRMLAMAVCCAAVGACSSARSMTLRVSTAEGEPMAMALVNASPMGLSVSPLPVSGKNIRESEIQRGTGGVTDRDGIVRLTLEAPFEYEVRVQPNPLGADALAGVAWVWAIRGDGTIVARPTRADGAARPVLSTVN